MVTGGIASGKSAVSGYFSRLGIPVIDTDRIAHQIVEPGQAALDRIVETFGKNFLDSDGRLNRRKMRQAIFSDTEVKSRLEMILHPLIEAEVSRKTAGLDGPYCILVIPLYSRASSYPWIDRVLVVDVPEALQIERVMARDLISREQAEAILQAQLGRRERLALADDIVENSGSLAELQDQVQKLHLKYLRLARAAE